jgi:hypothetical protein
MTAGVAALWVARHGGRDALRLKAQAQGTTVQAMWVRCAVANMVPPNIWNGSQSLGAGVLNAKAALEATLPGAAESVPAPSNTAVSTLNVLQMHLAGSSEAAGAAEVTPEMADFAPELIWLSFRAGAKKRLLDSDAEAVMPADEPSAALAAVLANAPALRAAIGR